MDLGVSPPANWLKRTAAERQESYPLVLEWCERCGNVQLRDTLSPEALYLDYLYVTPRSSSLQAHYEHLVSFLRERGYLTMTSFVVEPGSNAGHFLEHIRGGVRKVVGIDPAQRIAAMANEAGIPTICDFFTVDSARNIVSEHGSADVVIARHCLAHNPSPHEMVDAARAVLSPGGYFVIENAYVARTIENVEFDQVYHEHMFYFSIRSMQSLLSLHEMHLVDVTTSPIHGGSIVFVAALDQNRTASPALLRHKAREAPFLNRKAFAHFAARTAGIKRRLNELVSELRREGRSVYTYGATAKGNTLLNYVGLTNAEIPYCVDSTPMKWGRFLPGSSIEIIPESAAQDLAPDFYLLTAWNYEAEIVTKVRAAGNTRSRFIVPIPSVRVS